MKRIRVSTCILIVLAALVLQTGAGVFLMRRSAAKAGYGTEQKLAEAVQAIRSSFIGEVDEEALTDAAITGMVDSLQDQWSYYLPASEVAAYLDEQENRYGGIGLVLVNDAEEQAEIKKVYPNSPAGEAGIQQKSHFLTVNGSDVRGMDVSAVSEQVREAIETGSVILELLQPDGTSSRFALIPGEVYTDPVNYQVLDSGLGYIRIQNFDSRSGQDSIDAVAALVEAGVSGIIFDVRENPGGLLTELLKLLDYLLPEGDLFVQQNVDGSEQVFTSDAACVRLPMAVLINEDTFSAAEFFAAALSEYAWADTVGTQTTGKGYGQINVYLQDGSAIHISNIAYCTPKRVCLANVGLTPTLSVEMDAEQRLELYYDLLEYADDPQLQAAEKMLNDSIPDTP